MKHRLFNLAAATSLLLCVACLCLWTRSGFVRDFVRRNVSDYRSILLNSDGGNLSLELQSSPPPSGSRSWKWSVEPRAYSWSYEGHRWRWTLLRYDSVPLGQQGFSKLVDTPYWMLTLVSGILPALWFWLRQREKKAARRRGFEVLPAPAPVNPKARKTGPDEVDRPRRAQSRERKRGGSD